MPVRRKAVSSRISTLAFPSFATALSALKFPCAAIGTSRLFVLLLSPYHFVDDPRIGLDDLDNLC